MPPAGYGSGSQHDHSSEMMSERRFKDLQKRLHAGGYTESLTLESAALVSHLHADVASWAKDCQKEKGRADSLSIELSQWKTTVEPLRKSEGRLRRELSNLHAEFIRAREAWEAEERRLREDLKRVQADATDARFVASQAQHRVRQEEQQREAARAHLDQVVRERDGGISTLRSSVATNMLIVAKAQIRMNQPLEPASESDVGGEFFERPDPYMADMLSVADQRVKQLEEDVESLQEEKVAQHEEIVMLQRKVDARDRELERVGNEIRSGRSVKEIAVSGAMDVHQEKIADLEGQIDFLNDALAETKATLAAREQELDDYDGMRGEAKKLRSTLGKTRIKAVKGSEDAAELRKELEKARNGMKKWEKERSTESSKQQAMIRQLKSKVKTLTKELDETRKARASAIQERRELVTIVDEARTNADRSATATKKATGEIRRTSEEAERLHKENTELQQRVQQAEQERIQAIARAERAEAALGGAETEAARLLKEAQQARNAAAKAGMAVGQADALAEERRAVAAAAKLREERLKMEKTHQMELASGLEAQKRELASRVASLEARLEQEASAKKMAEDEGDFHHKELMKLTNALHATEKEVEEAHQRARAADEVAMKSRAFADATVARCARLEADSKEVRSRLKQALSDKAQAERELDRLHPLKARVHAESTNVGRLKETLATLEADVTEWRQRALESEQHLDQVQEEATSIQSLLDASRKERDVLTEQLATADVRVNELRSVVDEAQTKWIGSKEEVDVLKRRLETKTTTVGHMDAEASRTGDRMREMMAQLRDARSEAESARNTVTRLEAELRAARAAEADLRDQGQDFAATQSRQRQRALDAEAELSHVMAREQACNTKIRGLEDAVDALKNDVEVAHGEIALAHKQVEGLQILVRRLETARDKTAQVYAKEQEERDGDHKEIQRLESKLNATLKEVKDRNADVSRLRDTLRNLDEQRDRVVDALDNKAQALVAALKERETYEMRAVAAERALQELKLQTDGSTSQLNERDAEIVALTEQVHRLSEKLEKSSRDAHSATEEAHRLGEDLAGVVRENQFLNADAARASQTYDRLGADFAELKARGAAMEEMLRSSEQDRQDLLKNYQAIVAENERLTSAAQSAAHQTVATRGAVLAKDADLSRLQAALMEQQDINNQLVVDLQAAERKCDELSRSLAKTQRQLQQVTDHRTQAEREATMATATSAQLQDAGGDLQRQVATLHANNQSLRQALEQSGIERTAVDAALVTERQRSSELEHLLSVERLRQARLEGNTAQEAGEADRLRSNLFELRRQTRDDEHRLNELADQCRKQALELERLQNELVGARHALEASRDGGESARKRVEEMEAVINEQGDVIRTMDRKQHKLNDYVLRYETELKRLEGQLRTMGVELDKAQLEARQYRSEAENSRASHLELIAQLEAARENLRTAEAMVSRDDSKLSATHRQLMEERARAERARKELAETKMELTEVIRSKQEVERIAQESSLQWHQQNEVLRRRLGEKDVSLGNSKRLEKAMASNHADDLDREAEELRARVSDMARSLRSQDGV